MYFEQGKFDAAEPLYRRALKITEKALGPDHVDVGGMLGNLGILHAAAGNYNQAMPLFERAAESAVRRLELASSLQSERQQLDNVKLSRFFLDTYVSYALMAIEQPGNTTEKSAAPISVAAAGSANNPDGKIFSADELSRVAYSKMLAWKGSVLLRQRMQRLARQADNPKEQELWAQLVSISTRLATASLAGTNQQQTAAVEATIQKLSAEKEDLEAQLSRVSSGFRKARTESAMTPDDLAKLLPADTALVDLLQYTRRTDERPNDAPLITKWEQRLAAFAVRHDQPLAMIDLGPIAPIDTAVGQWRDVGCGQVAGKSAEEQPSAILRRLVLEPLVQHFNNANTILVSPDGSLNQIAWAALPGSKPGTICSKSTAWPRSRRRSYYRIC